VSRIVSAIVIIAVLGSALYLLPPVATLVIAVAAAAAAGTELAGMARALGATISPIRAAILGATGAVVIGFPHFFPDAGGFDLVVIVMLATSVWICLSLLGVRSGVGPGVFVGAGALLLSAIYVGLPLGALSAIRAMFGANTMVWLIAVIAISDSAQYYTGRSLGRRKLAPVVSPGKTIEGAIGGLVAAPIAGAALASWGLPHIPWHLAGGMSLLLAFFGMAGDLFESLLKRSAGVKDSSHVIPGHGGVLDRIDAYLFAAPMFYIMLRFHP